MGTSKNSQSREIENWCQNGALYQVKEKEGSENFRGCTPNGNRMAIAVRVTLETPQRYWLFLNKSYHPTAFETLCLPESGCDRNSSGRWAKPLLLAAPEPRAHGPGPPP